MNNSVIGNEEYRELMRKQILMTFKVMFWIFLVFGVAMSIGGAVMYMAEIDEELLAMFIPAGIMLVASGIFMFVIKNNKTKPFTNFAYEQFVAYETSGTKVPLYRVVSTGQSSQTIYMVLDVVDGNYKLYDIRRKKMKLFFEDRDSNVTVKFFYKTRRGLDIIKTKVQFIVSGKKYNVFGMTEVNDLFLNFLRNEGHKYETQMGRVKSL